MTVYKEIDTPGLPPHHFLKIFLGASPLVALGSGATTQVTPAYTDWLRHLLDPIEYPTRTVMLDKGIFKRIGIQALKDLPVALVTGAVGGALLDAYLKRKLQSGGRANGE